MSHNSWTHSIASRSVYDWKDSKAIGKKRGESQVLMDSSTGGDRCMKKKKIGFHSAFTYLTKNNCVEENKREMI